MGRKYSRDIYQKAKELYSRGYSIREISEMLGISMWTLQDWLLYGAGYNKYLGQKRKYSIREYYNVLDLFRNGYSVVEICRKTGIPRHTVREWVKRGKRPIDEEAIMIKYFSEAIKEIKKDKGDYIELLNNTEILPYILYLYGAVATDGYIYFRNGKFHYIDISGEELFLKRVNHVVLRITGREYKIFKAYDSDYYKIRIFNKGLGLALHWLQSNFQFIVSSTEDDEQNARALLLGLVDGDGSFTIDRDICYIMFDKRRNWHLVSYSAYLLRRLGIKYRFVVIRRKGGVRMIKGAMVRDRDRFRWVCRAEDFLSKVGSTIKVLKRSNIPRHIRNILDGADNPIK